MLINFYKKNNFILQTFVGPFIGIGVFLFLIHFYRFQDFGIYTEDIFYAVNGINLENRQQLFDFMIPFFHKFTVTRPLFVPLSAFLAYFSVNTFHHLWGLYITGFTVLLLTSYLFYLFLYKIWKRRDLAFFASLLYVSWPSDTLRSLNGSILPHLAFMFFWLFALSLAYKRKYLAVLFFLFSILIYEICILLGFWILALVLYKDSQGNQRDYKKLLFTITPYLLLDLVYLALRFLEKESRLIKALQPQSEPVLFRILNSMRIGSITSLYAPFTIHEFYLSNSDKILAGLAALFVLFMFLWISKRDKYERTWDCSSPMFETILFGLLFLAGSYIVIAFAPERYPPNDIGGRVTDSHKFGLFGLSIFLASISIFTWDKIRMRRSLSKVIPILLLFYSLARFGIDIQNDCVVAWQRTKSRWTQSFKLSTPLSEEKIVLVLGEDTPTYNILSNSWNENNLFSLFFELPIQWKIPRYIFTWDWFAPMQFNLIPNTNLARISSNRDFIDMAGGLFRDFNYRETIVSRDKLLVLRIEKDGTMKKIFESKAKPAKTVNEYLAIEDLKKRPLYHFVFK